MSEPKFTAAGHVVDAGLVEKVRWERAIDRARRILAIYKKIPEGAFGALMIQRDLDLYEAGDRSAALLESLEGTK